MSIKEPSDLRSRQEREREHFNQIAQSHSTAELTMSLWNMRRYDRPPETTAFPLEYAFSLLGDLRGQNVVDLGCGEGLNTTILAALGARVLSVDISDKSLETTFARARANGVANRVEVIHADAAGIPIADRTADRVLCAAILHHVDCVGAARQIHRILKPGGTAVFLEPLVGPAWLSKLKGFLPKSAGVSEDEAPLTQEQVDCVSQTVGRAGRSRKFLLTTRIIDRVGLNSWGVVSRSHRFDAWILRHAAFMRPLASPLVWEAIRT